MSAMYFLLSIWYFLLGLIVFSCVSRYLSLILVSSRLLSQSFFLLFFLFLRSFHVFECSKWDKEQNRVTSCKLFIIAIIQYIFYWDLACNQLYCSRKFEKVESASWLLMLNGKVECIAKIYTLVVILKIWI